MVKSGMTPNPLHLELLSNPAALAPARKSVEAFAVQLGFDKDAWCEIGLVVNEALANIIRHAYHGKTDRPIHLDAAFVKDALRIDIRDWGDGIDPSKLPCRTPDPRKPGGLGMVCLKELMDTFEFKPQDDGMLLTMTRKLRAAPSAASVAC